MTNNPTMYVYESCKGNEQVYFNVRSKQQQQHHHQQQQPPQKR